MMILGITGSIATGKSTVTRQFASLGVTTHEADHAVHTLLGEGGAAVEVVAKLFPATKKGKKIDRAALGKIVFSDKEKLQALEQALHPLVKQWEEKFATCMRRARKKIILFDIPLLFETEAERRVGKVIATLAPPFLQRARALARPGMTDEKLADIIARQVSQHIKRNKADFVIHTGLGLAYSFRQAKTIVVKLLAQREERMRRLATPPTKGRLLKYPAFGRTGAQHSVTIEGKLKE